MTCIYLSKDVYNAHCSASSIAAPAKRRTVGGFQRLPSWRSAHKRIGPFGYVAHPCMQPKIIYIYIQRYPQSKLQKSWQKNNWSWTCRESNPKGEVSHLLFILWIQGSYWTTVPKVSYFRSVCSRLKILTSQSSWSWLHMLRELGYVRTRSRSLERKGVLLLYCWRMSKDERFGTEKLD